MRTLHDSGYTLVEVLLAMVLMLLVAGGAFALVVDGVGSTHTQPEAADIQQRARAAADLLFRDLLAAGSGLDAGPRSGPLVHFFAPIVPRRLGLRQADPFDVVRDDAITIVSVPASPSQATLRAAISPERPELLVNPRANCPIGRPVCGISPGSGLIAFDDTGHFDLFTLSGTDGDVGLLEPRRADRSSRYEPGTAVAAAESRTYWFNATARQLRHYDGYMTDAPVADNVVAVGFQYFGDPVPPTRPRPPAGVANCLYDEDGELRSALAALVADGGSLARLPLAALNDGPWCGDGANRFDADLLRIRKVRVTIRLQTTSAALRGATADFSSPGTSRSARRAVADYSLRFDVSPRNLNGGR